MGGWIWVLAAKDVSVKGKCSLLQWGSKTLGRGLKSTFSRERLPCTAALDDLLHLANSLKAVIKTRQVPVTFLTNCASLWDHEGGQDLYPHLIVLRRILYPGCLPYQTFQMSSTFELPSLPLVKYFSFRATIILEKALKSQQDEHKMKLGYSLI